MSAISSALGSGSGPVDVDATLWPRLLPSAALDAHVDRHALSAALAAALPGTLVSTRALGKQLERALAAAGSREKVALPLGVLLGCVPGGRGATGVGSRGRVPST